MRSPRHWTPRIWAHRHDIPHQRPSGQNPRGTLDTPSGRPRACRDHGHRVQTVSARSHFGRNLDGRNRRLGSPRRCVVQLRKRCRQLHRVRRYIPENTARTDRDHCRDPTAWIYQQRREHRRRVRLVMCDCGHLKRFLFAPHRRRSCTDRTVRLQDQTRTPVSVVQVSVVSRVVQVRGLYETPSETKGNVHRSPSAVQVHNVSPHTRLRTGCGQIVRRGHGDVIPSRTSSPEATAPWKPADIKVSRESNKRASPFSVM